MLAILKSEVSLKGLVLDRLICPTCFFSRQKTKRLKKSVLGQHFFNYIGNNVLITLSESDSQEAVNCFYIALRFFFFSFF